jgi:predicted methyltransferase
MKFRNLASSLIPVLLASCGGSSAEPTTMPVDEPQTTTVAEPVHEPVPSGSLDAAIAGSHRTAENRARDVHRHPKETLEFCGIRPDMTVVELSPGGGWYTEILAPYLRDGGRLVAGIPSAEGERARYHQRFLDFVATRPDLYGNIVLATFEPPAPIELGEPASADMVVTFRNTHNWIEDDAEDEAYGAAFEVLEPGGIFCVVQHRDAEESTTTPQERAESGYVKQSYVVEVAGRARFELDEASEINANPRDTHDHPEGVWTLPPVLRLGDVDRDRWMQIGESDRMTLRFVKPAAGEASAD